MHRRSSIDVRARHRVEPDVDKVPTWSVAVCSARCRSTRSRAVSSSDAGRCLAGTPLWPVITSRTATVAAIGSRD